MLYTCTIVYSSNLMPPKLSKEELRDRKLELKALREREIHQARLLLFPPTAPQPRANRPISAPRQSPTKIPHASHTIYRYAPISSVVFKKKKSSYRPRNQTNSRNRLQMRMNGYVRNNNGKLVSGRSLAPAAPRVMGRATNAAHNPRTYMGSMAERETLANFMNAQRARMNAWSNNGLTSNSNNNKNKNKTKNSNARRR